jgi:Siphovirus-type tail component, C-terminal domain
VGIPVLYRPAAAVLTGYRVELDGWAAGMPGQEAETAKGVIDAQGTAWYLTKLEGWQGSPAPRTSLVQRSGEHGSFDGPAYLDTRAVTIEGVAVCTDRISTWRARDILASVCGDPSLGLSTLVVTQAGYTALQAAVRRTNDVKTEPMAPGAFRWSIILVAPDPRRYAAVLSSVAVGLPQVGAGGLVFPLVFPLTFGSGTSGGQMLLTNTGTMATWPRWDILGPVTGPVITNLDTGQRLAFDPTFDVPAGQHLLIDADAKTVFLAGVSRRDRLFIAEWFDIAPGSVNVRFSSAAGADPAALLTAQWREAWT